MQYTCPTLYEYFHEKCSEAEGDFASDNKYYNASYSEWWDRWHYNFWMNNIPRHYPFETFLNNMYGEN